MELDNYSDNLDNLNNLDTLDDENFVPELILLNQRTITIMKLTPTLTNLMMTLIILVVGRFGSILATERKQ